MEGTASPEMNYESDDSEAYAEEQNEEEDTTYQPPSSPYADDQEAEPQKVYKARGGPLDDEDFEEEGEGEVNQDGTKDDGDNVYFSDKASFREQSHNFQKVLQDSSKFRSSPLPEPRGQKPKSLQELSAVKEGVNTKGPDHLRQMPHLAVPQRPLSRGKLRLLNEIKENQLSDAQSKKPTPKAQGRFGPIAQLPRMEPEPRAHQASTTQSSISLPPVALPDKKRMDGIFMYSRHGKEINAKIASDAAGEPNSPRASYAARNTPRLNGPNSSINVDDATKGLASPRTGAKMSKEMIFTKPEAKGQQ